MMSGILDEKARVKNIDDILYRDMTTMILRRVYA